MGILTRVGDANTSLMDSLGEPILGGRGRAFERRSRARACMTTTWRERAMLLLGHHPTDGLIRIDRTGCKGTRRGLEPQCRMCGKHPWPRSNLLTGPAYLVAVDRVARFERSKGGRRDRPRSRWDWRWAGRRAAGRCGGTGRGSGYCTGVPSRIAARRVARRVRRWPSGLRWRDGVKRREQSSQHVMSARARGAARVRCGAVVVSRLPVSGRGGRRGHPSCGQWISRYPVRI